VAECVGRGRRCCTSHGTVGGGRRLLPGANGLNRISTYTKQHGAATTNAQRLRRYKQRMRANGFRRLSIWVHEELLKLILENRRPGECYGRTLERPILGERNKRHGGL
jgi:hypothetical protein